MNMGCDKHTFTNTGAQQHCPTCDRWPDAVPLPYYGFKTWFRGLISSLFSSSSSSSR